MEGRKHRVEGDEEKKERKQSQGKCLGGKNAAKSMKTMPTRHVYQGKKKKLKNPEPRWWNHQRTGCSNGIGGTSIDTWTKLW